MKLLHTSDWHVGKAIRGASRSDEHRAVLDEMAAVAAAEDVDVVVVAGDLFDTSTPSPESEEIVYRALLALARTGATVAVIAGNHDNARRLRAVAPLLELGNVHLVTEPDASRRRWRARADDPRPHRRPDRHAAVRVQAGHRAGRRPDGRRGVRERPALQRPVAPADRRPVRATSTRTRPTSSSPTPSCSAPSTGGGERPAHLVDEYAVTAPSFPATIGYGALGHLHRPQRIPAGPALHYCGSPLQLDFGEGEQPKQVNVVTIEPGVPADVRPVRLTRGASAADGGGHDRRAGRARRRRRSVAARRRARAAPGRAGRRRPPAARAGRRRRARRRPGAPTAARRGATTTAAARRSCSTSTWPARASIDERIGRCSASCSTRRWIAVRPLRLELEGFGAFRDAVHRRLLRHRARRARRRHRVGQVDDHRRHHVRPLRQRRPLRRQPGGRPGHQPDQHAGQGAPRLRGRRRAATRRCGWSSGRRKGRRRRRPGSSAATRSWPPMPGRCRPRSPACSASTSTSSTARSCSPRAASPTSSTTARPTARATLRQLLGLGIYQHVAGVARQRAAALRSQVDALRPDLDDGERELTAERRAALVGPRPGGQGAGWRSSRPSIGWRRSAPSSPRSTRGWPRSTLTSTCSPRCGRRPAWPSSTSGPQAPTPTSNGRGGAGRRPGPPASRRRGRRRGPDLARVHGAAAPPPRRCGGDHRARRHDG